MNLDDTALVVERITNRTSYQPFGLPVPHSLDLRRWSSAVPEGRSPRGEAMPVAASWIAIEAITLTQWPACTTASSDSCAGSGLVDLHRRAARSSRGRQPWSSTATRYW